MWRARRTRAYLFDDGTREEWVPKSQIEDEDPDGRGNVTLTMPEWLAVEKGFV